MKIALLERAVAVLALIGVSGAAAASGSGKINQALAAQALAAAATPGAGGTPVAAATPASDSYFGTSLTDNYRWMEGDLSSALRDFLTASTTYADGLIGRVQGRDKLYADIDSLSVPYVVVSNMTPDGETLFYLKRGPANDIARLMQRGAESGDERVLVDPETLPDARPHSEIEQIAPSPDGTFVAYVLADNGADSSVLQIYDAAHNATLREHIAGARFAAVAWLPDSTGLLYTRPVDGGGTSRRLLRLGVFMHRLGTGTDKDVLVLDAASLPFAFSAPTIVPRIILPPGSDYALAIISDGISQEVSVYGVPLTQLTEHPAPWKSLAGQGDGVTEVSVSGALAFLLTHAQAPTSRVVAEDIADPDFATARTVLPAADGVITGIAAASDALYAARRDGAGMQLLRLDFNQATPEQVRLPIAGTIAPAYGGPGGLIADPRSAGAFLSIESWMHPKTWLHYDLRLHRVVDPGVVPDFPRDVSAYQATETTARAKDGTEVPLTLIARRDVARDHARPALLESFGGSGYAFDARFLPAALVWADQGGVYAICHVRVGGEPGRPWHDTARIAAGPTAGADLLACADALGAQGFSSPSKIAAAGTGAGAIAVAGAMLERPDAFRAVLLRDGLLDPLRLEENAGSAVNATEFGSAHDPAQFPALLAMDAYQNVKDGTAYPAVLLTGSLSDRRVPVWQSAKMAARLAAASTGGRPVLLRVAQDAAPPGHAAREMLVAEELSFLLWQLDEPDFALAPPPPPPHAKHVKRKGRG